MKGRTRHLSLVVPVIGLCGCLQVIDGIQQNRQRSAAVEYADQQVKQMRARQEEEARATLAMEERERCTPPWGYAQEGESSLESHKSALRGKIDSFRDNPTLEYLNNEIYPIYKIFSGYKKHADELISNGCTVEKIDEFRKVFFALEEVETLRRGLEHERKMEEIAEAEKTEQEIRTKFRSKGFNKVIFSYEEYGGLLGAVKNVISSGKSVDTLKRSVVELNRDDNDFYITQVLPNNQALLTHPSFDVVIWLRKR